MLEVEDAGGQESQAEIEEYLTYREPAAVGVSFRRGGKIYYFAPGGLRVRQGDYVLAETERGLDIGQVVSLKFDTTGQEEGRELKPLLRRATKEDLAKEERLREKEREARKICQEKIAAHGLPMRLIAADYTFDERRLTFYFSAEGRVDFRALVRDLAETFRTRIELRQIGVRDQAKMLGGLGPCGRPLCCATFLRDFDPVGIRVAKEQGLSLNPAKISGLCDRLMCCLRFEQEIYSWLASRLPKVGQSVRTPHGVGVVKQVTLMHERIMVEYPSGETEEWPAAEVEVLDTAAAEASAETPVNDSDSWKTTETDTGESGELTANEARGARHENGEENDGEGVDAEATGVNVDAAGPTEAASEAQEAKKTSQGPSTSVPLRSGKQRRGGANEAREMPSQESEADERNKATRPRGKQKRRGRWRLQEPRETEREG